MSKLDTVTISSGKLWNSLENRNIKQVTISNTGTVEVNFDFGIGPSELANTGPGDTGFVYLLKDVIIPLGSTLVLQEDFMFNAFNSGQTIFTNTIVAGKLTRTEMTNPVFLCRTGVDVNESVDLFILRR